MRRRNSPPLGERIARGVGHLGFFVGERWSMFGNAPKNVVWSPTDYPQGWEKQDA